MTIEKRKRLRKLRGDTNLRWVQGDRVGEPSFIMELDDSLPPEEFMAQTCGNVADSICHTDAEVVVEFFNSMPELLDALDAAESAANERGSFTKLWNNYTDLKSENAALKARVAVLEEVEKAAEKNIEKMQRVTDIDWSETDEYYALRAALDRAGEP